MGSRHFIGALLVAALLAGTASAQTVTLKSDHPDRYIVQKGDTLWDISGRFLTEPWRWPEIWRANPQIKNPHLIYPGDEVVLSFEGGQPVVRVRRRTEDRPTVKLSPTVRVEPVDGGAIPTIPIEAIRQFLKRPLVVEQDTLDRAPYIVSVGKESLIARPGENFYARGLGNETATRFTVYRAGQDYVDPQSGAVIGYEAVHVGDAVLDAGGDPASLVLVRMNREVLIGDRLLPVHEDEIERNFLPRPPDDDVTGQIIAVVDGVTQIGQHQVVVLNRGRRHGIDTGHVMAVYQAGEVIEDTLARDPTLDQPWWDTMKPADVELDPEKQGGLEGFSNAAHDLIFDLQKGLQRLGSHLTLRERDFRTVKLPDERAGTVLVFRLFEGISYALVLDAERAMHVNDTVRTP